LKFLFKHGELFSGRLGPAVKMDCCDICGFKSTFSGIVRHRKRKHADILFNDSFSSSDSSYSTCESSAADGLDHDFDNESSSTASASKPKAIPEAMPINNFYLQCQLREFMRLSSSRTSQMPLTEKKDDAVHRVCSEFGKLVSELGISTRQTEVLLGFLRRRDLNFSLLPGTWRTLQQNVSAVFDAHALQCHAECDVYGDGEESIPLDISDVNTLTPTIYLVKRKNVLTAAIKQLLDRYLCIPGALILAADLKFSSTGERIYGEAHSADWWRNLCDRHVAPGCIPLVVNLFTDGTRVGRNTSRQPFVLGINNFRGRVQRSIAGKTILGYVPYFKGHEVGKEKLAVARARIAREVHRLLIEDLIAANRSVIPLIIHGKILHFQVFVQNTVLDGPETRKATGVLSACQTCFTQRGRFDVDYDELTDAERAWRTTEQMRAVITQCEELRSQQVNARDGTVGEVNALLSSCNVREVRNPWWDAPFASSFGIYGAVATDRMHLLQGMQHSGVIVTFAEPSCRLDQQFTNCGGPCD
jgi:hypothetical protein